MKNIRNNSFDQDEPDFESDEVSIAPKKKRFFLLTPEDEQEKRQYRNLMIFIVLMLILITASVFFKPDLKEVHITPKELIELEKKPSDQEKKAPSGEKKGMNFGEGKEDGSGKDGGKEGGKEGTSSGSGGNGSGGVGSKENNGGGKFSTATGSAAPQPVAESPSGTGEGDLPAMQTPSGPVVYLRDDRISKDKFNERKIFANLVNTSGKPLNKVIVLVKFLDHDKSVIHERLVNALVVKGGLFGDKEESLPDGEDRRISVHLDDLPKGWNGTYVIEIKTYE